MSLADCVIKLVAEGKLTKIAGDQALSLNERMKREVSREQPPASAEAASALIAIKTLRQAAEDKLRNVSANVNRFAEAEQRLAEHPNGKMAAAAGLLTRDLHRDGKAFIDLPADSPVKQGPNVEGRAKSATSWLFSQFATGMQEFKPGFFGHTAAQIAGIKNMIYEGFGVDTGDATAKAAWSGWKAATDAGVARAQQGGKLFSPIEDWRFAQKWEQWRVKQLGLEEFKKDIINHMDNDGLKLFDRDTGRPVKGEDRDFVINRAFEDITRNGGPSAPFSRESRTFVFQPGKNGADAYIQMMEKYGWGNNPMQAMVGHLDRMGKEIGLIETLGPNFEANWKGIFAEAKAEPEVKGYARGNPARFLLKAIESPGVVEGTFKALTGHVHPVHDDAISNWIGAARNMNVASSLRQAVFSVFPTDSVTQLLAGSHVGMDGIGHMASVYSGGSLTKAEAAHLHIQSNGQQDFVNGIRDYENHLSLLQTTGKFASATTKLTFLDQWGKMGKRTWATDMLNLFGSQAKNEFDKVDPKFKTFLDAYGFTAQDWDKLRGNTIEIRGAKYLDPNQMERPLYDRVMNAIQEQGAFAMHQPDARLRSIETGLAYGIGPGKGQEAWRSLFQFKTFALSRMSTQMMRVLTDGDVGNRVVRGTAFAAVSLAAGAASLQSLQLLNGKDPADMKRAEFWGEAAVKGGFGGFYGDLVAAAMKGEKSSGDVMSQLAGPLANIATDLVGVAASPIREEFDDTMNTRRQTVGRKGVNILKRNLPIRPWYAELAVERLLYDKLQTLVDPDYRQSFRRAQDRQRKAGSGYWWAPGSTEPSVPDLSTIWRR